MGKPTLSHQIGLVVPARNEAPRIGTVLGSLPDVIAGCAAVDVIVVDDGSDDGTASRASQHNARVVKHAVNLGKGAALRTGCEVALTLGCDLIAVLDGDGQHPPRHLDALVAPLVSGEADLTLAYRRFSGQMPALMRLGNWGLSSTFALLFRQRYRDTQCGYRAFRAKAYERLRWRTNGYGVETEMLVNAARAGLRVVEVPIDTVYHDSHKGTTVTDGMRIFARMLLWARPSPR
jgi:glycosyltransferase involved in cell wall biosynthesis